MQGPGTIGARFEAVGVENTEENRLLLKPQIAIFVVFRVCGPKPKPNYSTFGAFFILGLFCMVQLVCLFSLDLSRIDGWPKNIEEAFGMFRRYIIVTW